MLEPNADVAPGAAGQRAGAATVRSLYTRTMPGGGWVRVELVVSDRSGAPGERRRGRVVIEPRGASPRRGDGAPLVVEEIERESEEALVSELFRIARDNAAIARRVLRTRAAASRAD